MKGSLALDLPRASGLSGGGGGGGGDGGGAAIVCFECALLSGRTF